MDLAHGTVETEPDKVKRLRRHVRGLKAGLVIPGTTPPPKPETVGSSLGPPTSAFPAAVPPGDLSAQRRVVLGQV